MTRASSIYQDQPNSIRTLLIGIWDHISHRRRIQLGILLLVMLTSGLAELVSLGAVLPFLAVLSEPERLWRQPLIQDLANMAGFTSASQLLFPSAFVFGSAAVLAAFIRLSNLWLNGRLSAAVGSDLSCECYRRTLFQPYIVHLQRNSAGVISNTTIQTSRTVVALNSLLQLFTSSVVAVGLLAGLVFIDAVVAASGVVLFASAYVALAFTARRQLQSNSRKIAVANNQQLKALQEGLGAIRDVVLGGSQSIYLDIYRKVDRPQRLLVAQNVFLAAFPRYALEALGMVTLSLLGTVLVIQRGSDLSVIPSLGVIALAAQRLLPAFQQIYSGWAAIKANSAAITDVLVMLNQPLPVQLGAESPFKLEKFIQLKDVHFKYGPGLPEVLQGLNIEIYRGERIGLIGSTGSGKSTTVDLLMGLLAPSAGRVLVDGADLHDPTHPERLAAWRAAIAHVPQSIYLADSSIAENIAFGVPRQRIDLARVKVAAAQAQIASFIESSPDGYNSFVGERGICLSGGQRQRIGIARALYKQATVLVFDEATSALDSRTEETVMKSIDDLSESLTVIMIAHRLSTVESCDRVIRLEQGSVSADGPPQVVLATQD